MRLRNVKNKKEILARSKLLVINEKENKGRWSSIFNNDNEIHLEIGMGKGDFILGMSKLYPNINFIGVEKYDSILAKAVEKIEKEETLNNIRLIRMDAKEIEEVFDREITTIYLNFSDPWPKKRHGERRLTSKTFLKRYDSLFKNYNKIIIKTDNIKLFESSLISLNNYGYTFEEISLDLHNSDIKNNVMTEYEVKFSNRRINYLKASKKSIKT